MRGSGDKGQVRRAEVTQTAEGTVEATAPA